MSNQHIENLTIENFKCFKHLEVSNIGRVNLIGGKNNVGKTAFLESLELFSSETPTDLLSAIYRVLKRRQDITQSKYFEIDFFYDPKLESVISSLKKSCLLKKDNGSLAKDFKFSLEDFLILSINENKQEFPSSVLNKVDFMEGIDAKKVAYIPTSKSSERDIAISFGALTELDTEVFLNDSLSLFDDNILELKLIPKENSITLKLKLKNREKLVLLSSLGEGINRYIAILCAIWASKDSVLLIDEIENGIHYTNYKKLWKIIFQASNDANCQVFATTHSKECIEAFNEVQFENETCNAQYFELYRNMKKDGIITASNRSKEQLQYSLTHNGRIRGE